MCGISMPSADSNTCTFNQQAAASSAHSSSHLDTSTSQTTTGQGTFSRKKLLGWGPTSWSGGTTFVADPLTIGDPAPSDPWSADSSPDAKADDSWSSDPWSDDSWSAPKDDSWGKKEDGWGKKDGWWSPDKSPSSDDGGCSGSGAAASHAVLHCLHLHGREMQCRERNLTEMAEVCNGE